MTKLGRLHRFIKSKFYTVHISELYEVKVSNPDDDKEFFPKSFEEIQDHVNILCLCYKQKGLWSIFHASIYHIRNAYILFLNWDKYNIHFPP